MKWLKKSLVQSAPLVLSAMHDGICCCVSGHYLCTPFSHALRATANPRYAGEHFSLNICPALPFLKTPNASITDHVTVVLLSSCPNVSSGTQRILWINSAVDSWMRHLCLGFPRLITLLEGSTLSSESLKSWTCAFKRAEHPWLCVSHVCDWMQLKWCVYVRFSI